MIVCISFLLILLFNHFCFYSCILLIVWWCIYTLTTCHPFILRCLMHVKLNVIKLFNRLSLLANQNTSTSIQMMSIVSQPSKKSSSASVEASFTHNHKYQNNSSQNNKICIERLNFNDDGTNGQKIIVKNSILNPSVISNNRQKLVMSSSFQLYEDDLSQIDVKSLVSKRKFSQQLWVFVIDWRTVFCCLLPKYISYSSSKISSF